MAGILAAPLSRHNPAVYIEKRENVIVNRLNKTKVIREVDHEQERVDRVKKETAVRRAAALAKVATPRQIAMYRIRCS